MKRGTGLRRVAMRAVRRDHSDWDAIRAEVLGRDRYCCVLCSEVLDLHAHHRKLRSRGGKDDHPTLLTLCGFHHRVVHANPAWATAVGFMVPSWADPSDWPVLLNYARRGWESPRLWQVPALDGTWVVRAPHPDQHDEPAPWAA